MARTVTLLPPTINRETAAPIGSTAKRKVAAYARVSTDHEEQQSSYEAQCDYYTKFIQGRDDWEFAGIYSDEGISATSTKRREGFQQMVTDALDGKIDLVLTKSVSRFARNTVDSLTTIRKLKENGTEVYFEKEGIWTFDGTGEMLVTILSSLSQEESRSTAERPSSPVKSAAGAAAGGTARRSGTATTSTGGSFGSATPNLRTRRSAARRTSPRMRSRRLSSKR